MDKWSLLAILKDHDGYISGEEISKRFGVTRAAVWKYVNELKKDGYEIESKTNNGYRILPSFDILNEYEIKRRLEKKNLDYGVIYKASAESTNNDAKKLNFPNNIIIAAERQTAGKGRYGRGFYSENNGGIYFTLKIRNTDSICLNIDDITFFPLIAAAAVSRTVKDSCGIELSIKWPNDLLYKTGENHKKLCGILTEASIEAENRCVSYVIVGIGLNINNNLADFPEDIRDIVSSLQIISGEKYDRADIMCGITEYFTHFMNLPREDLLEEYKKRLLLDIDISFAQNGEIKKGRARGITETGNLTAELENGETTVIKSGEIKFI